MLASISPLFISFRMLSFFENDFFLLRLFQVLVWGKTLPPSPELGSPTREKEGTQIQHLDRLFFFEYLVFKIVV